MDALSPDRWEPDVAGDAGLDEEREQTEGGNNDTTMVSMTIRRKIIEPSRQR